VHHRAHGLDPGRHVAQPIGHDLHLEIAGEMGAQDGEHVRPSAERGGVDHVQDPRPVQRATDL
jgi:hypothetical protein